MFSGPGLTKAAVAKYYASVSRHMMPHASGRPLTLVFCPSGVDAGCSYLRHSKLWGPKVIRRVKIREKTKLGEYRDVDSVEGLVSLAQMNVVEIHTWNSCAGNIERPDRIVLDLDPGNKVRWPAVIDAARLLRAMLGRLGLQSWVKTTGGRGLHVVVPVIPERDWSECLEFARAIATLLVERNPRRYTLDFRKEGRDDKILVDYLRNNRTNTSVSAYSIRARPSAPVSMPVRWSELTPALRPLSFTVLTVPALLQRRRVDPWRDYWRAKQRIRFP